jgi:heat shock protein HslJ
MRLAVTVVAAFFFMCQVRAADEARRELTVTGVLSRAMAAGGETTGWMIHLEPALEINGNTVDSVEISYQSAGTLKGFENKRVKATGTLMTADGVERGVRPVLEVTSISEAAAADSPGAFSLENTAWVLEDFEGKGIVEKSRATLAFGLGYRVSGNASCNRFFGTATVDGDKLHLSQMGATRMVCSRAMMDQETAYLKALGNVERFEWKEPYLLLYTKNSAKPLKFTKKN